MEEKEFQQEMQKKVERIEKMLRNYLPEEEGFQKTVLEAMNYSVLAGGKRLRPLLMQETYRLFGGKDKVLEPFMAAIEMIHTYSLVHDDLPAMDDDEYRRGRRTTHAVYGEAMGILAGDGLLNFSFETALKAFGKNDSYEVVARALTVLAHKAGVYGMIGGQTADVEAEGQEEVSLERLLFIHAHKTAALIQAAMMTGAILAGATGEEVSLVEKCAYDVGVAFQIQDDILDVIGSQEELGKPVGSDAKNRKQTYVTIKGLEESAKEVDRLSREAADILDGFGGDGEFLKQLVLSLINRRN